MRFLKLKLTNYFGANFLPKRMKLKQTRVPSNLRHEHPRMLALVTGGAENAILENARTDWL